MEELAEELYRCLHKKFNGNHIYKKSKFVMHVKKNGCRDVPAEVLRDGLLSVAKLLLAPPHTLAVAARFPYLLVELLSLATLDLEEGLSAPQRDLKHQQELVALAKLSRVHPDALKFSLHYFEMRTPKLEAPAAGVSSGVAWISAVAPLDIIQACHLFLQSAPSHFRRLWDWPEIVSRYLPQGSMLTWLSVQCAAAVLHMSAAESGRLAARHLSAREQRDCALACEALREELGAALAAPGRVPPALEAAVGPCAGLRYVVPVAGVLLPVLPGRGAGELFLHVVPTTRSNLRRLAVAVASGKAVCLAGPVGSGKTELVEQLARLTGRDSSVFVKLQMSEEMDSKLLVGTYTTTSTLGEFKWAPGILTTALTKGQWLLVEDIDQASPDVAAVLSSVLEQGSLLVPGCAQPVQAAAGFHLFFTQRSSSRRYASVTNLLKEQWLQIAIHPLTKKELLTVVKAKFPLLEKWASRIVRIYLLFSDGNHHYRDGEAEEQVVLTKFRRSHNARHISTRDLMKYCQRIEECEEQVLFRHAVDIFCSNIADKNTRVKLAVEIGFVLGLAENISYQLCVERVPHFEMMQSELQIGAVSLDVSHVAISSSCGRRFSWTLPAAAVMETMACSVRAGDPVLLVGETATGKTLMVQHLAELTGNKVVVVNLSQQSDPADLLGGYKPVNVFWSLHSEFEALLECCSDRKTAGVVAAARKFFAARNWSTWLCLLSRISSSALQRQGSRAGPVPDGAAQLSEARWLALHARLQQVDKLVRSKRLPSLNFVEGVLVKAVTEGHWILLDEINMATPETLHCLGSLLESGTSSLQLLERGDQACVERHPRFRLLGCMNPSTDVGKRELPQGLRSRFTEIYVDEMLDPVALISLVQCYLQPLGFAPALLQRLVKFYLSLRSGASGLADGTGRKPHYSLRTLCRALSIAAENKCGHAKQSLFEGLCIAFLTQLRRSSYVPVEDKIHRLVFGSKHPKGPQVALPKPSDEPAVLVEGYWVAQGTLSITTPQSKYVLTETVRANLRELARAVSLAGCPVLLQGPTSVGKTSLVAHLAAGTGNSCVRVNNHEHTDLQEYVGTHATDDSGQLVFQHGVLVEAMKKGHWLILDELNLAPSDVLEALNRLLDDNRELYITETQEVIKAHKNFRIFATQNPPGVYGGRKVLSRAFRNRFVELHFDSIPASELQVILHECCSVPPSCCRSLVSVMNKLQLLRRGSATFAGRQGFMTLRDLFRWARRYHVAPGFATPTFYDWDQHMAEEGYLLLAGRVRRPEERAQIRDAVQQVFRRAVRPDSLFDLTADTSLVTRHILQKLTCVPAGKDLVWTRSMRQMAVLVCKAHQYDEPVLLVGGTGCGKTTLCEKMAAINGQRLYTINCHMNSESSDFLGGLRPTRDRSQDKQMAMFEWVDGPLVLAMKEGGMFLADEISLAEDSVLERLNPLLEPERVLLLSEKGSSEPGTLSVKAHPRFQFVGTMNPGGDFGKKELSPALRNRFTEIWCEPFSDRKDLEDIICFYLCLDARLKGEMAWNILEFIEWYKSEPLASKVTVSIRDILTWVSFMNRALESGSLPAHLAFVHGGMMTLVNGMCVGDTGSLRVIESEDFETKALHKFKEILKLEADIELVPKKLHNFIHSSDRMFGLGDFLIEKGDAVDCRAERAFVFTTPQTCEAALHVLRSMQLHRPVLLEGSPGVGKTALVQALASCAGFKLVRINLSEQTDVSDLFGADLPVEGGEPGQFAWHDGPFLQALKAGDWILLDELNLSSQSILEGLNACLDHRGEVYIPELGKTFHIKKDSTRIFATQNPIAEGGGRKGLPKSLLNRFLKVYIRRLRHDTYRHILQQLFPELSALLLAQFLDFVRRLLDDEAPGPAGGFNLRDACRWCRLVSRDHRALGPVSALPGPPDPRGAAELVYFGRMRSDDARDRVRGLYDAAFGEGVSAPDFPVLRVGSEGLRVGDHVVRPGAAGRGDDHRCCRGAEARLSRPRRRLLLRSQVPALDALLSCVTMSWHPLLVGGPASGKTSVVQLMAELVGMELRVLPMNSAMDTMEILGGFEQWNIHHHLSDLICEADRIVSFIVRETMVGQKNGIGVKVWALANEWWCNTRSSTEDGRATAVRQCDATSQVLRRLVAEWEAWNPACCRDLGVGDLLRRLEQVRAEATRDVSAGGGKFEWVDSLLVKCLKDGAWLLVENVNLCSSAVLDRLNALLEPGGTLSVDERGVGPDNKVVSVTPHPNFRVFFTMNPEYGEVSRAMRNRCVEIFMKPMSQTLCKLDSFSVLADLGLQSPSVLWSIQQEIGSFDNFGQLTWLAYMAGQQATRGLDATRALRDTLLELHGAAPGQTSRGELEGRLAPLVRSPGPVAETVADCVDLRAATLATAALNDRRAVCLVKQDCALLGALLVARRHGVPLLPGLTQLLPNVMGVDVAWVQECQPAEMAALFVIAAFFSTDDRDMKVEWVSRLFRGTAIEHPASEAVASLVAGGRGGMLDRTLEDSLHWLLMELAVATYDHTDLASRKPSDGTLRIVDAPSYAWVLQNHPMVSKCGEIIDLFDKYMKKLLQSEIVNRDHAGICEVEILLKALMTRNHFSAAVCTVMYRIEDNAWMLVWSSLKKLRIYYNWFRQYAVQPVVDFIDLWQVNGASAAELLDGLPDIETDTTSDSLASLQWHPPAWFSRGWPAVLQSLRRASASLSLWDDITDRKVHVLMDKEYQVASKHVISLITDSIVDRNPSKEVVEGVRRLVEAAGGERAPGDGAAGAAGAALWPVQELLCARLCSLLRMELLMDARGHLLRQAGAALCALPTAPLLLKVLVRALGNPHLPDARSLRVGFDVAALLLDHARASPALCLWQPGGGDAGEAAPAPHLPALAVQLRHLLQGGSSRFALPSLGSSQSHGLKLRALREMLWRNMAFFTSPRTDAYAVERQCVLLAVGGVTAAARGAAGAGETAGLRDCLSELDQGDALSSAAGWVELAAARLGKERRDWQAVGLAWVGLGLLRAKLQEMRPVSDWERRESLASAAREVTYLSKRLFALECWSQVKMCSILSSSSLRQHPAIQAIMNHLSSSKAKKQELEETMPERPSEEELQNMSEARSTYLTSITSHKTIDRVLEKILCRAENCDIVAELELVLGLNERHATQLRKYSDWFPDYIHPVMLAAAQLSYGLSLLRSVERERAAPETEPDDDYLVDLVRYPRLQEQRRGHGGRGRQYLDESKLSKLLECSGTLSSDLRGRTLLRLHAVALRDVHSEVALRGELDPDTWQCVRAVLKHVVDLWRGQRVEAERKKREEESLYTSRTKTLCESVSDDEVFKQDLLRLFPNSELQDFGDLQFVPDARDPAPSGQPAVDDADVALVTEEYLHEIHTLHAQIVNYTACNWRAVSGSTDDSSKFDHLKSWLERCEIFNGLVEGVAPPRSASLDRELYSSYLLMTSVVSELAEGGTLGRRTSEDFYTASNVTEVVSVIPILKTLMQDVHRLLAEWPENPILVQILTVAERILTFPVESAVSRFLAGLELLLPRVEEWEVNAHEGVSLSSSVLALNGQILAWKKLELASWRGLLSAADKRARVRGSQWWPHIYELLHAPSGAPSRDVFLDVVWRFMHESVLGEFDTRLQMLLCFHCDAVASRLDEHFIFILWNVFKYYAQFLAPVKKTIADLRAPTEKKLKDLVKISSWNYSNVAALKKSFEKSKRAIVKHVKEYEAVLKQPVFPAVTLPQLSVEQHSKTLQKLQALLTVDTELYVAVSHQKYAVDQSSASCEEQWCSKFRDMCRNDIPAKDHAARVCAIHEWSADTLAAYVHLSQLQVDRSLPLEKQRSWAKSSLQQRRRLVSSLLKELQSLGVSPRWGAGLERSGLDLMFLPAVDAAASLGRLPRRAMDDQLAAMWAESEPMFHQNIARLGTLRQALNNPSKDIEHHLIGRMRGCTSHLMHVAEQERVKFEASLRSLCLLRFCTWQLTCVCDATSTTPSHKCQAEVKKVAARVSTHLTQLSHVFDSYPKSSCSEEAGEVMDGSSVFLRPLLVFGTGPAPAAEELAACSRAKAALDGKAGLLAEKLRSLNRSVAYEPQLAEVRPGDADHYRFLLSPETQRDIDGLHEQLLQVGEMVKDLCRGECGWFSETPLAECMSSFSESLIRHVESGATATDELPVSARTRKSRGGLVAFSEGILTKVLDGLRDDASGEQDAENMLKMLERLDDAHEALCVDRVLEDLSLSLSRFWLGTEPLQADKMRLGSLVPLLEQFACLCQLLLVMRLSVSQAVDGVLATVLTVFEELARKGYQIPEELMPDEDGQGDGRTGQGGLGLGDGEGQQDVSDRIESEDQLEEARPTGEEPREDPDQRCPEENENAIEMSEDFGGEVGEAKEATDDEEGPEKSDGENADDEMGSASDNEQDKPYWGSDQSGDEEGDEEDGRGQEQGKEKTRVGAKDDESPQDREQQQRDEEVEDMDDGEEAQDQVDPYHGNMEPPPEPEPLEMPEDLRLDDGEAGDDQNGEDEANPFDIDEMKEVEGQDKDQQGEEQDSQGEENEGSEEATNASDEEHQQPPEEGSAREGGAGGEEEEKADEGEADLDEELAENSKEQTNAGEEAMDADGGAQDQATANPEAQDEGALEADSRNEEAGVGRAEQASDNSGHQGEESQRQATRSDSLSADPRQARSRQRPRESQHRTLGSAEEPVSKRLKTIEAEEREADERTDAADEGDASEETAARQDQLYQHVDDAERDQDTQALDAATEEQAREREWRDMDLAEEDEAPEEEACPELKDEEVVENQHPNSKRKQKANAQETSHDQEQEANDKTKVAGEIVPTLSAERFEGVISQGMVTSLVSGDRSVPEEQASELREVLLEQLASWTETLSDDEARMAWGGMCYLTGSLAQELSEQLRMILEPTRACRLKGDYKSGRRINMRKVIPYIASGFRKDKIWLRRTKLSKREYQILLAIDDSQSMRDNRSKELAFESLALVSQALVLLEAGRLGVVSFGEEPVLLHPLSEPFTDASGAGLVQRLEFKQARTRVGKLVEFATCVFGTQQSATERSQLLIVISDGRGVDSEGPDVVRNAIQQAQENNIFIVYIIVDSPQESILDVCSAVFEGSRPRLTPYMETFPFPFYLVLKDISQLPLVLSDALRQWFELVASIEA
ncbi:LOW QUALITY PROTEIN: midasin-like [Bacillus rossius redtenbacheri]|uniref:LOW QUALITY PROTEIN: midasin-like n=1 Tax=Bacillus rossius redtenbacheri TaxID=93214 RepID=UPI002FDDA378